MEGSLRDTVVVAGAVAGAVTQDPGLPQEDPRIGTFNFDIDTVMNKGRYHSIRATCIVKF